MVQTRTPPPPTSGWMLIGGGGIDPRFPSKGTGETQLRVCPGCVHRGLLAVGHAHFFQSMKASALFTFSHLPDSSEGNLTQLAAKSNPPPLISAQPWCKTPMQSNHMSWRCPTFKLRNMDSLARAKNGSDATELMKPEDPEV